ncbi:MAG: RNA methyltransferase [Anaerolineales bacterium]|nr:RNA methyltransferase [Anaerolineales bacterium]
MPDITSLQNPRVKYIVKLRDDRRLRQRDGVMLVEGAYEIELALAGGMHPREVFFCGELAAVQSVTGLNLKPLTVSRSVFEKMSHREGPDGWLAVFPLPRRTLEQLSLSRTPLLVLVESVEKPGNLGAILRTSDAVGADGLLVCDPRVDVYSPNVVRASRGTLFTLPVIETTSAEALAWLRAHEIRVLAATPQAKTVHFQVDLRGPLCIAVGAEDEGLSTFWLENADLRVKIPMVGKVNSLNVSVSTAVLLYEAIRQRREVRGSHKSSAE